jgi:transcriptional regulator with XRE-family HTH domain
MDMTVNSQLVRELRNKANWSQEDLAAASGLSIRTIQRVENEGKGGLETRRALAAAFGVTARELDLVETAYQPGEMAIGTGLLLVWIGIAWFFNLGLGIGVAGPEWPAPTMTTSKERATRWLNRTTLRFTQPPRRHPSGS